MAAAWRFAVLSRCLRVAFCCIRRVAVLLTQVEQFKKALVRYFQEVKKQGVIFLETVVGAYVCVRACVRAGVGQFVGPPPARPPARGTVSGQWGGRAAEREVVDGCSPSISVAALGTRQPILPSRPPE